MSKRLKSKNIARALVDDYLEKCGGESSGFTFSVDEKRLAGRIAEAVEDAYRMGLRDAARRSAS